MNVRPDAFPPKFSNYCGGRRRAARAAACVACVAVRRARGRGGGSACDALRPLAPRVERLSVGDDDEDRARRNTAFAAMPLSQARKSDILGRAQRTSTSTSHAADRP